MKPNTRQPRPPKAPVLKPEPLKSDADGWAALDAMLSFDSETGILTWKLRPREFFGNDLAAKRWNARFAGRTAFTCVSDRGYFTGKVLGQWMQAHRVAWMLYHREWPSGEIDHINGDRGDNRICNLRVVSRRQNSQNVGLGKRNVSGHLGVHYDRKNKVWVAQIRVSGKCLYLGSFRDKDWAILARLEAEDEHGFHPNTGQRLSHNSEIARARGGKNV